MNDVERFDRALETALARWNMSIGEPELGKLRFHFEAMISANRSFNITRITDPVEVAVKHYADSLALIPWAEQSRLSVNSVVDVGTGGGFPAVPVAVMRPDWELTALEATRKKQAFVARTAAAMTLGNLSVVAAHSDQWRPHRKYDVVALRAIAKLATCLRKARSLVSPGGYVVAYKTATLDAEELDAARAATAQLGLRRVERFLYDLFLEGQTIRRALYVFQLP